MARFDVFEYSGGAGFLVDVQSDLLSGLNTRMVIPLLPRSKAPKPAQRLNPVVTLGGSELIVATQFMAAISDGELRTKVGSLASHQDDISAALDMLFLGF
ncbi:MAG: CcdB family protein [Oceanococcaceae bacterium]